MKAAATAWHASPKLFAQGFAARSYEPQAVTAALKQPGVVLKRPYGTSAPYKADPDVPAVPRLSAAQKRKTADAQRQKRRLAKKEAKIEAARAARRQADTELAQIEKEEASLRERRRAVQRKFHLYTV